MIALQAWGMPGLVSTNGMFLHALHVTMKDALQDFVDIYEVNFANLHALLGCMAALSEKLCCMLQFAQRCTYITINFFEVIIHNNTYN